MEISSDGSNIYINGDIVKLTEFDGTSGSYIKDNEKIQVSYKLCGLELKDCLDNRQGVHEADCTSYKKSWYYDAYLESHSCMHAPYDDMSTVEAIIDTTNKEEFPISVIRDDVYNTMMSIDFNSIESAIFSDTVKVIGNGNNIIVRNTDITIPGILTVGKGSKECTSQVDINGITCMKYESNSYDFYQYGDVIIKTTNGTDISPYIELLPLS